MSLMVLLGAACGRPGAPAPDVEPFLANHWADPVPAQGTPPAAFSALEASLSPESCGQCHPAQWQQWKTSLHSQAVGPGLLWQLRVMSQPDGNRCMRCHAPLTEQKALMAAEMAWPVQASGTPPAYVPADLARQGLVCAACHVRGHRRLGPVPVAPAASAAGPVPHGGFDTHEAFSDSRFCAHCHQFPADGPRVAGKLNEDTYEQWKASPWAGQRSCQSCHMPDRQHLWRGIHDREMTRQAIEVDLSIGRAAGGQPVARAVVRNVGAGHHFPTYMVPKVELRFSRVHDDGRRVDLGTQVIGWTVDVALQRELQDTRIPAGESRRFELPFAVDRSLLAKAQGWSVELAVVVRPAEHYERTFRESLTRVDSFPLAARGPLQQALANAVSREYELLRARQPLTSLAP